MEERQVTPGAIPDTAFLTCHGRACPDHDDVEYSPLIRPSGAFSLKRRRAYENPQPPESTIVQ
jgi:hypothetical protein